MQGLVDKGDFNLRPQLKKLGTVEKVQARVVAIDAQNSDIDSDDQQSLSQGSSSVLVSQAAQNTKPIVTQNTLTSDIVNSDTGSDEEPKPL